MEQEFSVCPNWANPVMWSGCGVPWTTWLTGRTNAFFGQLARWDFSDPALQYCFTDFTVSYDNTWTINLLMKNTTSGGELTPVSLVGVPFSYIGYLLRPVGYSPVANADNCGYFMFPYELWEQVRKQIWPPHCAITASDNVLVGRACFAHPPFSR